MTKLEQVVKQKDKTIEELEKHIKMAVDNGVSDLKVHKV